MSRLTIHLRTLSNAQVTSRGQLCPTSPSASVFPSYPFTSITRLSGEALLLLSGSHKGLTHRRCSCPGSQPHRRINSHIFNTQCPLRSHKIGSESRSPLQSSKTRLVKFLPFGVLSAHPAVIKTGSSGASLISSEPVWGLRCFPKKNQGLYLSILIQFTESQPTFSASITGLFGLTSPMTVHSSGAVYRGVWKLHCVFL